MVSEWWFYAWLSRTGPDRWASRPTARQAAPGNARKSRSETMTASPAASCGGLNPSSWMSLWSLRSAPPGVTPEVHQD